MDLTDEQWELVRPSIPEPETMQPGPKGGRPYRDPRDVLNAVLWILRTGAPWAADVTRQAHGATPRQAHGAGVRRERPLS